MLDLNAFFHIKFLLLSACQEIFQDVSIVLDFLDQDTQVLHALAKKSSTRAENRTKTVKRALLTANKISKNKSNRTNSANDHFRTPYIRVLDSRN
jgi:hypothetical protein